MIYGKIFIQVLLFFIHTLLFFPVGTPNGIVFSSPPFYSHNSPVKWVSLRVWLASMPLEPLHHTGTVG